jgi:Ca2+-binding RTX toxin-like protein
MSNVSVSSLASVYAQLTDFANLSNFWSLFNTAFGSSYDSVKAASFRSQWQSGDFSLFPQIEVVSGDVLGTANGAYAISTNKIYLSDAFISSASQQSLEAVILEEFGHFVDAQVNATDTAGDEGELFSALVRGVSLSAAELGRIKAEDDHGIMSLGGQLITIEKAAPTILTVTTTADQNNGVTTDGLSLREAILIANANPNTDYEIQVTGGLTYNLTANGINENAGKTGDLDIASRNNVLYIVSVGAQKATINASTLLNSDRVFHILGGGAVGLENVIVTGGLSNSNGGGILVEEAGILGLTHTDVTNNQGFDGGGIYNDGTTLLFSGSAVNNNTSTGYGGGIRNYGNLKIIDSTISNNNGSAGGGIYNSGTQTLINTTVSNNTAKYEGGGIYNYFYTASSALLNTTVSGNKAEFLGAAGIANAYGIITIKNSTVTNNTFSGGTSYSGGISNDYNGTVNLSNTIVAGNFALEVNVLYPDLRGKFNGNNNNLIGILDGAEGTIGTGTDIVNANVQLSPLQNNGGFTLTHIPLSGSPAINAGNNNQIPVDSEDLDGDGDTTEQLPFDARNLARISGGTVDIGAVEVQNSVILPSITLAVAPASVLENGTTNLVYTFTRTGPTTNALTVNYSIAGTAIANDYTGATPGTGKTITFAAGSATATLTIDPTADTTIEANETVALTLATGTGYTIGTATAVTGTITNDDVATLPSITLAVTPASVLENGTTNLVYTFTRTGATTNALTVNYGITGTADATDYTGATPGTGKTITFAAGSATATLTIDPTADTTIENDETVALTLATGTGYTVGTTTAVTGTITNDDLPSITLAVAPASVLEDGTPNLVYTFTRTGATTNALTVNYGITGTADATDYTGATPGTGKTITFAAGSATATVTVNPTADTTIENNETVALTLTTGTGYTIGTTTAVTGTITNDDGPTISLGLNYSAISEDSPSNFIYTFTRTGATTNSLTVNYSIAGTALSTDYTGATPGTSKTITFAAGSATATLTLDPTADTTLEPNETVILQLVSGTGYTIVTTAAQTATIINDDNTRNQQGTNGNSVLLGKNYSDYLTGGTGNDILNGADSSDYLTGAAGNDTLTGGSGGDTFFFANPNLGIDTITDFTPNEDTIFVSASGFGSGLIAGNPLTQTQFILGSSATSASQRFIYNSTNGALSFDGDGNGLGTAKQIATLSIGLALTCEDIFVG